MAGPSPSNPPALSRFLLFPLRGGSWPRSSQPATAQPASLSQRPEGPLCWPPWLPAQPTAAAVRSWMLPSLPPLTNQSLGREAPTLASPGPKCHAGLTASTQSTCPILRVPEAPLHICPLLRPGSPCQERRCTSDGRLLLPFLNLLSSRGAPWGGWQVGIRECEMCMTWRLYCTNQARCQLPSPSQLRRGALRCPPP